ncbi:MAG: hypothetical protein HW383_287 [Candidatus Magasanikbacteria bacterium]|nr:hypothetical protein [Candidatus Magasanikbacteria bacterium]
MKHSLAIIAFFFGIALLLPLSYAEAGCCLNINDTTCETSVESVCKSKGFNFLYNANTCEEAAWTIVKNNYVCPTSSPPPPPTSPPPPPPTSPPTPKPTGGGSSGGGTSASGAVTLTDPLNLGDTPIPTLVGRVIKALLGVIGALALLMFVYGGFLWMTSFGNNEKIKEGKNIVIWTTIGITTIFASYALVSFVIEGLTTK